MPLLYAAHPLGLNEPSKPEPMRKQLEVEPHLIATFLCFYASLPGELPFLLKLGCENTLISQFV